MKNFLSKIAAIAVLLTAVAFSAASCSKDNDSGNDIIFPSNHSTSDTTNNPVTPPVNPSAKPSIVVLAEEGYVQDGDIVTSGEEFNIGFVMASSAETGAALATLVVTIDSIELETVNLTGTEYTYTRTLAVTFDEETRELPTATITAFVTDVRGKTNNATITVSIETLLVATPFEWFRQGQNQTGLEEYGLFWEANIKDVHAQIKPLEGVTLYRFRSEDWISAVTESQKAALFSDGAETMLVYNNVSPSANGTYDDVIGTQMADGTLHLIHVMKCEIGEFSPMGFPITISGESK